MDSTQIDWKALDRLRRAFLDGTAGAGDYWQSDRDLASYDATFAQRIGWKWDYVLGELRRRGWSPPKDVLLDWGCGSGIASRAFLDHFGVEAVSSLALSDRSSLAVSYASRTAQEKYRSLDFSLGIPARPGTLLLSHVLTELTPEQIDELVTVVETATTTIWVEPGTYEVSLALIAIRERLREHFNVVAPCTHCAQCGILASGNERHWCHHFASPPPGVFTDPQWSRFAHLTGIDLRRLPLSFLVLDRRTVPVVQQGATRVIGNPRIYKPYALLLGCDAQGVRDRRVSKRQLPEDFRRIKKGIAEPLQVWTCEGDEIISMKSLLPEIPGSPGG